MLTEGAAFITIIITKNITSKFRFMGLDPDCQFPDCQFPFPEEARPRASDLGTHLVDQVGKLIVEGLDLFLLLGSQFLDFGVYLQVEWGQKALVHTHGSDATRGQAKARPSEAADDAAGAATSKPAPIVGGSIGGADPGAADRAWGVGATAEGADRGRSGAPVGFLGHRDGHFCFHPQGGCQSEQ